MIPMLLFVLAACDSAGAVSVERNWGAHEYDQAALERILAPDFAHLLGSGQTITKAQHITYMASHQPPAGFQLRFERLDVRLIGGVAIATGIVVASDDVQADRFTAFTDIFACRDGRWQAVGAQETPIPLSTNR
ncbi:MAG TPA: nuclear transport factor 2 family protein [Gemmatimonadaceae bacterium]|jgi:hypothetical protein|nr:nuclear transport factor 2 family protein [Gemmatimonadaceae bacterium]